MNTPQEKDYELKVGEGKSCDGCAVKSKGCGEWWTKKCFGLAYGRWVKREPVLDLCAYVMLTAPASCPDPCKICILDGDACLQLPKARAICSSTAVDGGGYWVAVKSSETEGADDA